ncbi:MAG TPA: toll/interleukin-1 receptor domain-containing protein, partial [Thermoanaerobaculia bacterium]|nr:toll/interleukin-1 receptor domain-containing protein [Thermoanaerobaculia bacterium]
PQNITDDPDKVRIFISHSKSDGALLAESIHDQVRKEQLDAFFDTYDILPGTTFAKVIESRIRKSIVLVVLTDTFASREWCRLEVLTARRLSVPVVVLHALKDREPRSFPYLGNVPVVAGASGDSSRIAEAAGALLDESLEDLYWRLHRKALQNASGDAQALVIAHAPDLLTLVQCDPLPKTIVYPDPPLGRAESELLEKLAKDVKLHTPMSLFVE